jgi:hypothetical protein
MAAAISSVTFRPMPLLALSNSAWRPLVIAIFFNEPLRRCDPDPAAAARDDGDHPLTLAGNDRL